MHLSKSSFIPVLEVSWLNSVYPGSGLLSETVMSGPAICLSTEAVSDERPGKTGFNHVVSNGRLFSFRTNAFVQVFIHSSVGSPPGMNPMNPRMNPPRGQPLGPMNPANYGGMRPPPNSAMGPGGPGMPPMSIIAKSVNRLPANSSVTVQWLPAHIGIPRNELADSLAKSGDLGHPESRKSTTRLDERDLLRTIKTQCLQE
ncbi:SSBP2 [Cordylochernes scorpioides]|uniref:SSBP2 n=1 Tax=Cordylochernes scorpioides TaxID=51811 RepID=A0ABY6LUP1_9ARAC|nr:SSBP2 [Cordylochernes scorpioides]